MSLQATPLTFLSFLTFRILYRWGHFTKDKRLWPHLTRFFPSLIFWPLFLCLYGGIGATRSHHDRERPENNTALWPQAEQAVTGAAWPHAVEKDSLFPWTCPHVWADLCVSVLTAHTVGQSKDTSVSDHRFKVPHCLGFNIRDLLPRHVEPRTCLEVSGQSWLINRIEGQDD